MPGDDSHQNEQQRSDPPSSSASSLHTSSPPTSDSEISTHHADIRQLLQSQQASLALDYYVPVGVFRLDKPTSDGWTELEPKASIIDVKSSLSRLVTAQWIRAFVKTVAPNRSYARVFLLPDDVARGAVPRDDRVLRKRLSQLISALDISKKAWHGTDSSEISESRYPTQGSDEDSLFYLFNTIPSPTIEDTPVNDGFSQQSIDMLLQPHGVPNLRTATYGYQSRTAACIIRRETQPRRSLDPRLAPVRGPLGHRFHYDCHTGSIFLQPMEYEEARGGILAESMGLGKTLICLTVICATKGHLPGVPPAYSIGREKARPSTGKLSEMAAATTAVEVVPWRFIWRKRLENAQVPQTCISLLEANSPAYYIPPPPKPQMRRADMARPKCVQLCSATLVVAPRNLISHWLGEIEQHFRQDTFRVLVLDSREADLPDSVDLLSHDILLFSTQRFEQEFQTQDLKPDYRTALLDLHFLRVIMDEGHEFATGSRNKAYHALARLVVERKWIVSGTPVSGLLGVEVGKAAQDESQTSTETTEQALERRKKDFEVIRERKILQHLRVLVEKFLDLRPWSNSKTGDCADWNTYIMPYDDGRRKPASLKNLLDALCVRHLISDIEAEISLPPLHNRTVYLKPCLYDSLSQNAFIIALITNAVTSERTDEDYMFHAKNRPALNQLINNLRQSGFYWTSHSPEELRKTIEISKDHLEKLALQSCTAADEDFATLQHAVRVGEFMLSSLAWRKLSELHEMGVYVEPCPVDCHSWSVIDTHASGPLITGATQLWKAQTWIDEHLHLDNAELVSNLKLHGEKVIGKVWKDATVSQDKTDQAKEPMETTTHHTASPTTGRRVPTSPAKSAGAEPKLTQQSTLSRSRKAVRMQKASHSLGVDDQTQQQHDPVMKSSLKSNHTPIQMLDESCELSKTCLSGLSSAKLTYLLDKIATLHTDEKILVFYEGDHIAYFIAQALDLIGVQYLIYTRTLDLALKSAYIATFNVRQTIRVLIMNLSEAAHGLHIASASRVFFVNPVWQPDVEAQAIKRAHRIGQKRPVYVETLVLEGTIEAQMLHRRQRMSNQEHENAEKSLLDDAPMTKIIQNAKLLPISAQEAQDPKAHFAKLESPIKLFGQQEQTSIDPSNPYADFIFPIESQRTKKMGVKKSAPKTFFPEAETRIVSDRSKRTLNEYQADSEVQSTVNIPSRKASEYVEGPAVEIAATPQPKKKKKRVGFVDEPALIPTSVAESTDTDVSMAVGPSVTMKKKVRFDIGEAAQPSIFGAGSGK